MKIGSFLKKIIYNFLLSTNYRLISKKNLFLLNESCRRGRVAEIMLSIDTRFWASILSSVNQSKSQFLQDIFVLSLFGFKKKGYFVDAFELILLVWQSSIVFIMLVVYIHMLCENRKQDARYAEVKKADESQEEN